MNNHPRRQAGAPQVIIDVPAELLEGFIGAVSKLIQGMGPNPAPEDVKARLAQAAKMVGVDTPQHAGQLALRFSLLTTILTKNLEELKRRGLVSGEQSTTFAVPFIAAVARIPARVTPQGPVCDMAKFWAVCDACAMATAAEPKPSA